MKRSSMPSRRKSLRRGVPLRRTAIRRTAPKPAVPVDVRAELAKRSDGECEIQLRYRLHRCLGVATDPHHRIPRGDGGVCSPEAKATSDRLSNLLHACRPCHRWVHDNPAHAEMRGLILKHGVDSTAEWVVRRGVHVWLDDFGGVHQFEEGVA